MKKRFLAMVLVLMLLLSACQFRNTTPIAPALIGLGEWDFDIYAVYVDRTGVDWNTPFRVATEKTITADYLYDTVSIDPEITFTVHQDDEGFLIVPDEPLSPEQIYQIRLNDPENNYRYRWAFQTKKVLSISGTLPGNRSTYAPVNTGIEVIFSHQDIENFSEVFSIQPHVEGRFSQNGHAMIFIPEGLNHNTTYTVTIDEGAKVRDSDLVLEEAYVFTFTTESSSRNVLMSMHTLMNVFTTRQNHFIPVYMNKKASELTYDIKVFSYSSSQKFLDDLEAYDSGKGFDALYGHLTHELPEYLSEIESYTAEPVPVNYGYANFHVFDIPSDLSQGYYLVQISHEEDNYYSYIQVNDLLVYNSIFEEEQFFWILDAYTHEGQSNAQLTLFGDTHSQGVTGADGTALVPHAVNHFYRPFYGLIQADGYPDFVVRNEGLWIYHDYFYDFHTSNDYFRYLYTDRSTYLPSDTLNLFGYLKPKKDEALDYHIHFYSHVNGDYLLDERPLSLTNVGTFTENFSWESLTPGWYSIQVTNGAQKIIYHEFYINEYTKPIYKVDSWFDKDFILVGDTIEYNLQTSFFEGGPVGDMTFNYYMHAGGDSFEGQLTSNAQGEASLSFTPKGRGQSWRPESASMEIYNRHAEDQPITSYARFTFLPKTRMLELEYDPHVETPSMTILGHALDASKYQSDYSFDYKLMRGQPLSETVDVSVVATWYEQKEIGEVYDFINKLNRKTYESVRRTETLVSESVQLVNGQYILDMPFALDDSRSYEVRVTMPDGQGGRIVESTMVNHYRVWYSDPFANYFYLSTDDSGNGFGLNDAVHYSLTSDGIINEKEDDKLIVMLLQNGLVKHLITDDIKGSFEFIEDYIPNIMIHGVYVKDGFMYKTMYPSHVTYDYHEREMSIHLKVDDTVYGPGDEVTIDLTTYDAQGNPYPADVNISIVDEAYFALYGQDADLLSKLYEITYGTGILTEFVSSEKSGGFFDMRTMAEMGGDFAEYYVRGDFKDTATFITVRTDATGQGKYQFKLPDNLTSWRITYQGLNDRMEGTTGRQNIVTKLPFHVSTIISRYFITNDEPHISLRVFGEEAVKGSPIDFRVVLENQSTDSETIYETQGFAGEYTHVALGSLPKGDYQVTIYATDGTYTDALQESFQVVDSAVFVNLKNRYLLKPNMVFAPIYSMGELTFFNNSQSDFYNSLLDLRFLSGSRVDQLMSQMEARRFIKDNFDPSLELWESSLSKYQSWDGGIKLLPYGDSDTLMTLRVILMNPEYFNQEMLITYLRNHIMNPNADLNQITQSLASLAALNKPVLLDLYDVLDTVDLTTHQKIVMALGFEAIGDVQQSISLYEELRSLNFDGLDGENYLNKAMMAVLAVKLGDVTQGDLWFKEIYQQPSRFELSYLEQLTYIKHRNVMETDEIKSLTGQAVIQVKGQQQTIDIFGFETKTITVSPEDLSNMVIQSVTGDMGVYVFGLADFETLKTHQVDGYTLTRHYSAPNENSLDFQHSDLIKVTLTPSISEDDHGTYIITDFIPAGFRLIKSDHWYEQQGQKVSFYYWSRQNPSRITYYMQAVLPGTYTADHATITRIGDTGVNYTDHQILTVR